ncbi:hypothetical protein LINPERHAP1_LOCUS20966 [Linum perenne]
MERSQLRTRHSTMGPTYPLSIFYFPKTV